MNITWRNCQIAPTHSSLYSKIAYIYVKYITRNVLLLGQALVYVHTSLYTSHRCNLLIMNGRAEMVLCRTLIFLIKFIVSILLNLVLKKLNIEFVKMTIISYLLYEVVLTLRLYYILLLRYLNLNVVYWVLEKWFISIFSSEAKLKWYMW